MIRWQQDQVWRQVASNGRECVVRRVTPMRYSAAVDDDESPHCYRSRWQAQSQCLKRLTGAEWMNPRDVVERRTYLRCHNGHVWFVRFRHKAGGRHSLVPKNLRPVFCPECHGDPQLTVNADTDALLARNLASFNATMGLLAGSVADEEREEWQADPDHWKQSTPEGERDER